MQLTAGLIRPVAQLRRFCATFRSAQCHSDSAIKTLDQLNVRREGDWIVIETHARGFLHHQVRSMLGCLALVGIARRTETQIGQALWAADRQEFFWNAPLHALYSVAADYPE